MKRGSIIKGNWKLVKIALLPGKTELFDLTTDPGEKTDVAAQNKEVVRDWRVVLPRTPESRK